MKPIENPRTTNEDIRRSYKNHPADSKATVLAHQRVRELLAGVACALNEFVPEGRHKALMLTALEEARLWGNTAVAVSVVPE